MLGVKDRRTMTARLNTIEIGTKKLRVNLARFNRKSKPTNVNQPPKTLLKNPRFLGQLKHRDSRSYAEVVRTGNHKSEFVRKDGTTKPPSANLEFTVLEEEMEWLNRSAIATVPDPLSIPNLQNTFNEIGLSQCEVRPMGGAVVLLTFDSKEGMEKAFTDLDLSLWFDSCKPWDPSDISSEYFCWLNFFGVPPHAWTPKFLAWISCLFGRFVRMDKATETKSRLDIARCLIITTTPRAKIDREINVKINEQNFSIQVVHDPNLLGSSSVSTSENFPSDLHSHPPCREATAHACTAEATVSCPLDDVDTIYLTSSQSSDDETLNRDTRATGLPPSCEKLITTEGNSNSNIFRWIQYVGNSFTFQPNFLHVPISVQLFTLSLQPALVATLPLVVCRTHSLPSISSVPRLELVTSSDTHFSGLFGKAGLGLDSTFGPKLPPGLVPPFHSSILAQSTASFSCPADCLTHALLNASNLPGLTTSVGKINGHPARTLHPCSSSSCSPHHTSLVSSCHRDQPKQCRKHMNPKARYSHLPLVNPSSPPQASFSEVSDEAIRAGNRRWLRQHISNLKENGKDTQEEILCKAKATWNLGKCLGLNFPGNEGLIIDRLKEQIHKENEEWLKARQCY